MFRTMKLKSLYSALLFTFLVVSLALPLTAGAEMSYKEATDFLSRFGTAMSKVAEHVKPAVVNISTTKTVKTPIMPYFNDPMFRRFFGQGGHPQTQRKVSSLGSGVIVSADGYILTNNHVIADADDIVVKLSDNRDFKGKLIGTDPKTDIAVIKIEADKLPFLPLGDSDDSRVGDLVLAIGNPYGLSQTITMGIISAMERSGIGITDYEDFIQTDAAINPGNSGGALVNVKGQLIGINTAIYSTSGGYQGIGFAIPSSMVKNVMDSIIKQGRVVRGYLGVTIQPVTPALAKQFNLKGEGAVLLVDVLENGPADKGGIKRGDAIVEYDGRKVETPLHFRNMVASTLPGTEVLIRIVRNGKAIDLKVTIGEFPGEQTATGAKIDNGLKGVSVQDISDAILQKLGITKKLKGVIVTNIDQESAATGILSTGDIIIEVNRRAVTDVNTYTEVASGIEKGQDILLLIVRGGNYLYITVPGR